MRLKMRYRRCGADPPRNDSGTIGAPRSSHRILRYVSARYDFCIGAKTSSNSKLVTPERLILYTRSLCSSATMMLSMPHVDLSFRHTTIRKGGQTTSISLTGVFSVQISRRFRRSGNQKQRIAIFDIHAPAYAMHVFRDSHRLLLGLDSHNNQIFLRGQRQGARRLS